MLSIWFQNHMSNMIIFCVHSLVAQLVKNLPAMQETQVRLLGWEDPLEKGWAIYSSILELPWWLSWQKIHLKRGRPGFDPWVGKIPWGRKESDTTNRPSRIY